MSEPEHKTAFAADTGRKLNVHKKFSRRLGRLLNVFCAFSLRPVSTGLVVISNFFLKKKKTTPEKVGNARIIPHKEKVFVRWLRWLI